MQKILDSPPLKDVHELRSVMGFFSYYRRFIPDFNELAKPMMKLTEKDRPFEIKHRTGKQHGNGEGMSRCPLLWCAQCET